MTAENNHKNSDMPWTEFSPGHHWPDVLVLSAAATAGKLEAGLDPKDLYVNTLREAWADAGKRLKDDVAANPPKLTGRKDWKSERLLRSMGWK